MSLRPRLWKFHRMAYRPLVATLSQRTLSLTVYKRSFIKWYFAVRGDMEEQDKIVDAKLDSRLYVQVRQ